MSRAATAALLLALAARASGAEQIAILAVGDPPAGPDGDLAELAHQLRAACRDRVPNVEDPSTMRARLLGRTSNATESELDRAYGGALVVFQNGEFESALRTLRAIVEDLEALPETEESYFQWKRALLRLALSAIALNDPKEAEGAFGKLARTEPTFMADPDQFSPGFRKRFEEVKARVRAVPRRKLTITADGAQGSVFVNGKPVGTTPVTVALPAGSYRVGGATGPLRVPSFRVDLDQEDRTVVLDFALASSLRMNAGPGLALAPAGRANGVIRAGAWLGVDKLIVVSRSEEGQAQFLVGSIYDVLRGALLREGSVRMVAGGVPSLNLSALAAFLLTGQSSREVRDLSREGARRTGAPIASSPPEGGTAAMAAPTRSAPPAPPGTTTAVTPIPAATKAPPTAVAAAAITKETAPAQKPDLDARPALTPADGASPLKPVSDPGPDPRPSSGGKRWMGPAAIGAGVLALAATGFALQQSSAADKAFADAKDQLQGDGTFKSTEAQARWSSLRSEGQRDRRNAAISAGAAVTFAVTACVLGWNAWRHKPQQTAMLTIEF